MLGLHFPHETYSKTLHWTHTFLPNFYLLKYWGHVDTRDICCEDAEAETLVMVFTGCLWCEQDRIESLSYDHTYTEAPRSTDGILMHLYYHKLDFVLALFCSTQLPNHCFFHCRLLLLCIDRVVDTGSGALDSYYASRTSIFTSPTACQETLKLSLKLSMFFIYSYNVGCSGRTMVRG